jgi:CHAT domain-containing protein
MDKGLTRFRQADYKRAEEWFEQAQEIVERSGAAPILLVELDLRRAPLLFFLGRKEEAESLARQTLSAALKENEAYFEAASLGNLGWVLLNTNRYDQSIYWLERALAGFKQLGSMSLTARTVGNLASCYMRLGDYDSAEKLFREAESQARNTGNRYDQQTWLGNLGNILLLRGDFGAAATKYREALDISRALGVRDWTSWWLYNLANTSISAGDFDQAESYNADALQLKEELADHTDYYPRVNEAQIAAGRKQFDRAENLFRALLTRPSDDPVPVLEAELGMAQIQIALHHPTEAEAQFRSAISRIESRRAGLTREEFKLSYFDSLIRFYEAYVDYLVGASEKGRALEVAESSRARLLAERVADSAAKRTVNAAALQALAARSGGVLLSYWLAPNRSFVWVITPRKVEVHELPAEREITGQVERYRALIEHLRDPLDTENPAGRKLSEMLLGPVAGDLAGAEKIVIVADRALTALNFETLPDPANPRQYLIDRYTIAVAPSLGVMLGPDAAQRKSAPSILLMGDPERAAEEFPPLPFAGKEIDKIAARFPEGRSKVVRGAEASPGAYRTAEPGRYPWIHFAAHASANRERPLESSLILSPGESGYALTARDVMQTPLHADLVTLSACRGAGARAYSGEGLVGLAWAFLRAGSRSVVAGLWDVTDSSTATLMADFYDRLLKDEPPPVALRGAKLAMLHSHTAYAKPFYWGPFQVYLGAPR